MQKYRYFYFLTLAFVLTHSNLIAQTNKYSELYSNNEFGEIEKLVNQGRITDSSWNNFFKTLFESEADAAISSFISIYQNTNDNSLKKIILDRLSQYYYAKGLYETADKILKDKNFREHLFSIKKTEILFGVQLGAFSSFENAQKSKDRFSKEITNISIISKNKNGRNLYFVIAGKFSSQREAQQLKQTISNRYGHKGIVIQY